MASARLLLVDDDPSLRQFLRTELELEGYSCQEAATGQQALLLIRAEAFDLLLLDWTLPDFSGVEICRRLRTSDTQTPVLMLTGVDGIEDRVKALDAGADDYLVKPFSIEELLARLRALLRRSTNKGTDKTPPVLSLADLEVNTASHEVTRNGRTISLSSKEYQLLLQLLLQANAVVEREVLLAAVWGENFYGDPNVLDVYIRYLRQKLELPGMPTLIQTVRGVGYMLKPAAPKT
jgi:two-component system response regulator MprA